MDLCKRMSKASGTLCNFALDTFTTQPNDVPLFPYEDHPLVWKYLLLQTVQCKRKMNNWGTNLYCDIIACTTCNLVLILRQTVKSQCLRLVPISSGVKAESGNETVPPAHSVLFGAHLMVSRCPGCDKKGRLLWNGQTAIQGRSTDGSSVSSLCVLWAGGAQQPLVLLTWHSAVWES